MSSTTTIAAQRGNDERMTVIFDCDGVLVNSEWLYAEIFSDALATIGIHKSAKDCFSDLCGLPLAQCYEKIEQALQVSLPDTFPDRVHSMTSKKLAAQLKANPGVKDVLDSLNKMNVPICVASNGMTDKVKRTLASVNLDRYFSQTAIFGLDQVGRAKPAPDIFLYAAESMRVSIRDCYVVEDSAVGVEAALASGAKVLHYDASFIGVENAKRGEYSKKEKAIRFNSFKWLLQFFSKVFKKN